MVIRIIGTVILLWLCFHDLRGESATDYQDVLTLLFTTNSYNKKVRPIYNHSQALELDISFYFAGINGIDEVKEKLTTTGFLAITWTDEFLIWNPASYGNLQNINIPQNDIWKPDLVLKNGFTKFKELGGDFYYLSVTSEGWVTWLPYQVFETRCSLDMTYFPFDKQICNVTFVIWSHDASEIRITKSASEMTFYEYEENSVWTIESVDTSVMSESIESSITFRLYLKRKPLYFVMIILLPIIFLGILKIVVFVIPTSAGEKMGFSVTVFLSFAVFLTIVCSQLPVNSERVSVIGVYLLIHLTTGVSVIVITAIQIRLYHRNPERNVTNWCLHLCKIAKIIRCFKVYNNKVEAVEEYNEKASTTTEVQCPDIKWTDVSDALDLLMFWCFLILEALLSIIVVSVAVTKG